ncbi:MAG: hypothetical protein N4A76_04710 [Firmicutes bacterium]|jgi:CRISPR-associated protein Csh1|nr:hypothetical protein [Bacillota bacterium]
MIENLIESFKTAYKIKGDDLIVGSYKLDQGLYIKVDQSGDVETLVVTKDVETSDIYDWFAKRDMVSKYFNSNKCIPSDLFDKVKNKKINSKRISSNNYLSIFIKKDTFLGPNKIMRKDEIIEITDNYYDYLSSEKLNSDEVLILLSMDFDEEKYMFCKNYFKNNYDNIFKIIKEKEDQFNNYVKIFFDFDFEIYERESNRYYYHKVFNTDDHKVLLENQVYGVSNFNMGLNAKKPFLEHKTMKNNIPYRVSMEDAMIAYKYSLFLKSQGYGNRLQRYDETFEKPLSRDFSNDDCNYMNLSQKNGEVEIIDYDIIPAFSDEIDIVYKNHLEYSEKIDDISKVVTYSEFQRKSVKALEQALDKKFFNGNLIRNYKTEPRDISDKYLSKGLINYLVLSRDLIFDFSKKGIHENIKILNDNYSRNIVLEVLIDKSVSAKRAAKAAADAFNLYYSIMDYCKGGIMMGKIKEIKLSILDKVDGELLEDFENIGEYSFAAGQITRYLFSKSEASKKTHDMVEPFLTRDSVKQINEELLYWFKRYSHGVNMNDKRFNKMYSMVLGYDNEAVKDNDMFLAGYLADNLMYTKREEKLNEK